MLKQPDKQDVANLLLVRGMRQQRDRAVRLALGASRRRLIQLLLTESCLLAAAGAAVGVVLAVWLKQFVQALALPELAASVSIDVPLDGRVLATTLAVSILCGLAAGLTPAWIGSSPRLAGVLGQAGDRATRRGARVRTLFAAAQLALSLTLLTGALLMVETVRQLRAVDLGFDESGVSTYNLRPGDHGYTAQSAMTYYGSLLGRLAGTPGLGVISLSQRHPFGSSSVMRLQPLGSGESNPIRVFENGVTPDYFALLSIPIRRGRGFTLEEAMASGDANGAPVIVSESLARRLFGDLDAVGRRIGAPRGSSPARELVVVGVAADARWNSITDEGEQFVDAPQLFLYVPFGRSDFGVESSVLMVKSERTINDVSRTVQAAMTALDPTLPAFWPRPLTASIDGDNEVVNRRVLAWALSMLGGLGFVLAAFGLAGLLAQIVSERTREFGVRLAIGADRRHLYALVLRQAAWIAGLGVVAGLLFAWTGSRLLEAQLYGVSRFDARIYAAAAVVLAVVVFLAAAWPGRTAARINPIDALRSE